MLIAQQVNGWQIGSTIATACAVVIALAVAVINLVQRQSDKRQASREAEEAGKAQARLILIEFMFLGFSGDRRLGPRITIGKQDRADTWPTGPAAGSSFEITNESSNPILDLRAEIWVDDMKLNQETPLWNNEKILKPDTKTRLAVSAPSEDVRVTAWRVRWTDANGRKWCRDREPTDEPNTYDGQAPRKHIHEE
ncbi:hypothetical protein [Lentzea kentuckyensis]|uniref:hypothetical protein n=1 Tax=Lentzea kentuckyensis TaxID=360086 RepID=UPI00117B597A|nr:hypothetical protein [Lentzea kentuckyensis]